MSKIIPKQLFVFCLLMAVLIAQDAKSHQKVTIIDGEEHVMTPFGMMLKECVQPVPSGTYVSEQEDGTVKLLHAEANLSKTILRNEKCIQRNPTKLLKEWIDNGGWDLPSGLTLKKFEGNYRVPDTPQTDDGQWLYYFIGSQNNDGSGPGVSIIQPVLSYHQGWYFQSWNCCPDGMAFNSEPVYNINPYDTVYGSVEVANNNATIISKNAHGQKSTLTVSQANRNFNWIDATLEVYDISKCSDFPNDYLQYSNMKVTLSNGKVVKPQWSSNSGQSQCAGKTSIINPSTIRIQHNLPSTEQY